MMERLEEKPKAMVPAVDVDGLANNLQDLEGLGAQDKAMHVKSLYQYQIEELRDRILNNRGTSGTHFVSGQLGSGKTTALGFFADDSEGKIKAKFEVLHLRPSFSMDTITWDDPEVSAVDVLVHIGETLFREAQARGKDDFILKHGEQFRVMAKNIQDTLKVEIEQSGSELQAWVGSIFKFFTKFNLERNWKKVVREQFQNRDIDLVNLINKMVDDFQFMVAKKEVLLIIDDWEKLSKHTALRNVFELGMPFIQRVDCRKIIPVPVHLTALRIGKDMYTNVIYLINKVDRNMLEIRNEDELAIEVAQIEAGRDNLRNILRTRIASDRRDSLVESAALDYAIDYSGGMVRQFLKIMLEAAQTARFKRSDILRKEHVVTAVTRMRGSMSMGVVFDGKMVRLLHQVILENQPSPDADHELIIEAFVNLFVYLNMNGHPCFHVNPMIREAVEVYARPRQHDTH